MCGPAVIPSCQSILVNHFLPEGVTALEGMKIFRDNGGYAEKGVEGIVLWID